MDGNSRHEMVKELSGVYKGDYKTVDQFYLADLNFGEVGQHFPAMIATDPPTEGDTLEQKGWHSAKIHGEVYEISDNFIPFFDGIEAGYFRKQIIVEMLLDGNGDHPMEKDPIIEATVYLMPMGDVVTLLNQVQGDWNGAYSPPLVEDFNVTNRDGVEWMEDTLADFNDNAAATGIVVNFEDYLEHGDTLLRKGQD
jgi:gamma-glutamylcyclotransferase (GGCT)/AIG2-like uncharacterized protein YtfP